MASTTPVKLDNLFPQGESVQHRSLFSLFFFLSLSLDSTVVQMSSALFVKNVCSGPEMYWTLQSH